MTAVLLPPPPLTVLEGVGRWVSYVMRAGYWLHINGGEGLGLGDGVVPESASLCKNVTLSDRSLIIGWPKSLERASNIVVAFSTMHKSKDISHCF